MRNIIVIILMLIFSVSSLTGCMFEDYEETNEYPIESIRHYVDIEESGVFTTKTDKYEYVEYVYIDSNGEYCKINKSIGWINISNESKVVEKEGEVTPTLYLTLEDYEKLLKE